MKTFKKFFIVPAVVLAVFAMTTPVKADLMNSNTPTEIYFNMTDGKTKDQAHKDLWSGFEFVVSKTDTGVSLTLKLTPEGLANGYGTGDEGIKFKNFGIDLANWGSVFTDTPIPGGSTDGGWSNGGWTGADNKGTSIDLTFASGMDWDKFLALAEEMVIKAHIQSINAGQTSLNEAEFTYYGDKEPGTPPTTPEPATMLIIGLGLAGLGLTRRKK